MLADQTEFRFVPDLTVADTVDDAGACAAPAACPSAPWRSARQVGADGVIFGRVFRFQKRVGTAVRRQPSRPRCRSSSAWSRSSTGEVVWQGEFDETQEPLTSNLLNWWMFWSAGPRWFSAGELAGLGVEQLFGR